MSTPSPTPAPTYNPLTLQQTAVDRIRNPNALFHISNNDGIPSNIRNRARQRIPEAAIAADRRAGSQILNRLNRAGQYDIASIIGDFMPPVQQRYQDTSEFWRVQPVDYAVRINRKERERDYYPEEGDIIDAINTDANIQRLRRRNMKRNSNTDAEATPRPPRPNMTNTNEDAVYHNRRSRTRRKYRRKGLTDSLYNGPKFGGPPPPPPPPAGGAGIGEFR